MTRVILRLITGCVIIGTALPCFVGADDEINLRLTLRDQITGKLVPGRITIEQRGLQGGPVYHFVKSLDPNGTAVKYDVARSPDSFEKHTTVSAHPFGASVPPGMYVIFYEHGPEWRGNKAQVWVKEGKITEQELPISRWIDMNERGWFSGDTHVHRSVEDLPNVMRAEDLNVALPLSYWVRAAYTPPAQGDKTVAAAAELITVDPNRVIWPINTEYELFTLGGQRHTQGAVFVLNHQQPLTLAAPPVAPIAAEARRQGAILDLDKHSWPWSMMLVPIMEVDLFELSNNHIWRTEFYFKNWTQEMRPEGWNIETDAPLLPLSVQSRNDPQQPDGSRRGQPQAQTARGGGFTEWGWIDFGFKSYYALLNCGFKMRPTAGTASGVHPVPLGYGRVYVECPDEFSYENWMNGLDAGRSFVTTGPMLFVQVNEQPPGSTITVDGPTRVRVHGIVEGKNPLKRIEIVAGGRVVDVLPAQNEYESPNIFRTPFDVEVPVETTSWVAVRCFEDKQGNPPRKMTFAHSSPVHIEMPGRPLRPRKIETDYFIRRMEEEIQRNRDVLRPDELAEYERARDIFREIATTAIDVRPITDDDLRALIIPEAELPENWSFFDITKSELRDLGGNPIVVSEPSRLDELPGLGAAGEKEDTDIVRRMIAIYTNQKTEEVIWTDACVCVDDDAAKQVEKVIDSANIRGKCLTWRRGELIVLVNQMIQRDAGDYPKFIKLIDARVRQR